MTFPIRNQKLKVKNKLKEERKRKRKTSSNIVSAKEKQLSWSEIKDTESTFWDFWEYNLLKGPNTMRKWGGVAPLFMVIVIYTL